jgi:two-component system, OmpR family, alkaline phosphatase synthesis response regulator PhoP
MDKILFADDDLEIQRIVNTILSKEGFEVIPAHNGAEALSLAEEKNPDLIILDYLMPVMDGIEACRVLKTNPKTQRIPVIMITAYAVEKENSLTAGAVDFIAKPLDKIDLMLRIRSILKVKHIKNELQKVIAYIAELDK